YQSNMPRPTSRQKKSRKAYEAKAHKLNTNVNNFEAESSDDIDSLSACDEVVDNNDAANIMKRLQVQQREAAKGTPTLHTFWAQKKSSEETSEAELYDDVDERLENERQLEEFDDEQLANEGWLEEVDENDIGG
ncbi:142_t:CDS:2, partial [Cetraspora pellucida]